MEIKRIASTIGTLTIVGAAFVAGSALWTRVLDRKFKMAKMKRKHSKSSNVIIVDFKKAQKDMGR